MTTLTPRPLPPHTTNFIESATPKTLLEILSGFSVNLDKRAFSANSPSNRAELERRVKLLLSDSQRLSTVLPKSKTTYASLPLWTGSNRPGWSGLSPEMGPICEVFAKNFNIGQTRKMADMTRRITEVGEFKFYMDACQMLVTMASSFDRGHSKFTFQDSSGNSGIALRVIEARCTLTDPDLPILFVLFAHETTAHAHPNVSPSLKWIQHILKVDGGIVEIKEGTAANSHLLLRQLIYNSHRLPPGCEPMFDRTRHRIYERDFVPSFLLPLDPLSHKAVERLSRSQKCARIACGKPAFSLCAGCGMLFYCSLECQEAHRGTHRELCKSIDTTPPPRSTRFIVFPPVDSKEQDKSSMDTEVQDYLSQRDCTRREREERVGKPSIITNPFVDRGFLTSFARRGSRERFVIRMQESLGGAVLLVYDAEKTFRVHVRIVPDLCELVAANRKWKGRRCYLYARHLDGDRGRNQLEVLLDVMPDQGLFW